MENILYERNVLEFIDKALELEKITFLLGSRQTGKTSLMKLTLDRFSNRGYTCFYIDMDKKNGTGQFCHLKSRHKQ